MSGCGHRIQARDHLTCQEEVDESLAAGLLQVSVQCGINDTKLDTM